MECYNDYPSKIIIFLSHKQACTNVLFALKDIMALTRPKRSPMAADAKNIMQNLPSARKNAAAPLAAPGMLNSKIVLQQSK